MRIIFILFLSFYFTMAKAQTRSSLDSVFVLPDTVVAFTIESLYTTILESHPIVKQTRLLSEVAKQEIRLARGSFDPKIETRLSTKELNNKEYYNKWIAAFTVPTWLPLDPKVGIEQNSGLFIDPENTVPAADNNQQIFTGISLPVGKGLLIDDRRAALLQAKLFTKMAEAEQIKLINKILLEAAKDYWQWYYHYYNYRLLSQNATIAKEIFSRVKLNATFGEASGVDTVQAKITLQQRLVEQQESYLEFTLAGIRISNYLWDASGGPLSLSSKAAPVLERNDGTLLELQTLSELTLLAKENHPELIKLGVKLDQLEIDRKLAAEYLKPRLDLSYTFLNQPIRPTGEFQPFTLGDNYKFGLDFSMPILIRKERAKLAQTRIKIKSTDYELTQTQREIINQVNSVYNQIITTNKIIDQQNAMAHNYERLLQAELLNLENGESDLFKINVQQEKLIQSQSKLLKLKAEYEKLKATLYWAAGIRNLKTE
ncbi:MAG: TolC family protein [Cyclobacteriaceae bacterium]|nr:TolC family protein [Cyclobacteriaceae bacterium]